MDKKIKESVMKYGLHNAFKFNGKANAGAVIGKVLSEDPSVKDNINELKKEVDNTIKEISKLSAEEIRSRLEKIDPSLLEEKKHAPEKRELKELKGAANGKVVMRFAPSPSGPMHIGHAYVLSLNSEYCRKYNGKLILRIEDTNSENIDKDAYGMLPEDGKWITKDNISEVYIQSDRLGIYYDYAEKLIDMGKAYVCTCDNDEFKKLLTKSEPCDCRELAPKEHNLRFQKMFSEYKPGEAVMRIKTDLNNPNPAMRDWPAMRINDSKHPRKGDEFKVWPLMNFSVVIDDHEMGVTHAIRGKDHMDNEKRQRYVADYFGWKMPENLYVGRINFEGMELSCSKTRLLIEEGKYSGWDDIQLPFLRAMKRRGYQPDAFIKYSVDVGVTQTDKHVSAEEFFKALNFFNKEVIDEKSNRYFFMQRPKKINVENAPEQDVELDLHPNFSNRGKRTFKTKDKFYIEEEDYSKIKDGELIRLMDCLNFVKKGKKIVIDSLDYANFKEKGKMIVHWLPEDDFVKASVLMPDKTLIKGYAEKGIESLKEGDIVQFERFGFCRLDSKKKNEFWFGHK